MKSSWYIAAAGQRCCRSVVIGWKIRMGDGMEDTYIFQISTSLFEFSLPFIIGELERQKSENGRYGRFFTQLILFKPNLEHIDWQQVNAQPQSSAFSRPLSGHTRGTKLHITTRRKQAAEKLPQSGHTITAAM